MNGVAEEPVCILTEDAVVVLDTSCRGKQWPWEALRSILGQLGPAGREGCERQAMSAEPTPPPGNLGFPDQPPLPSGPCVPTGSPDVFASHVYRSGMLKGGTEEPEDVG